MKTIIKALLAPCMFVAAAFLLAGCGPSTLDFRNAEVVNGKIFRAGADKPYSGHLTNVPARTAIMGRKDYAAYHQTLSNVYTSLGIQADIYTGAALCEVDAEQGFLDGKAVCRATVDQLLSDEMSFDKGALDGRIKTYFPRNGGKLAAEAQFDNGVLDGDMTMYGPESGRKILQVSFKQGRVDGKQEIVDDETGKLVLEVIERINRELGTTAVVITHNAAIAGMADRVIRLANGRVARIERNARRLAPSELSW